MAGRLLKRTAVEGAPVGYGDDFSRKLIGKAHIFWSGLAAASPYKSRD
jgi:hypothetical protein